MSKADGNGDVFRVSPAMRSLRDQLSLLRPTHRVAFALYCCERLFPFYVTLARDIGSSDAAMLRALLDELWGIVPAGAISHEQVQRFMDQTRRIDLGEEGCSEAWDGAVDAVGAVSLALEAWRDESSESAAKAGGNVRNRVYQRLTDEAMGAINVMRANEAMTLTRRIELHPAMKRLQEQLVEVIQTLGRHPSLTESEVRHLRSLAQDETL